MSAEDRVWGKDFYRTGFMAPVGLLFPSNLPLEDSQSVHLSTLDGSRIGTRTVDSQYKTGGNKKGLLLKTLALK